MIKCESKMRHYILEENVEDTYQKHPQISKNKCNSDVVWIGRNIESKIKNSSRNSKLLLVERKTQILWDLRGQEYYCVYHKGCDFCGDFFYVKWMCLYVIFRNHNLSWKIFVCPLVVYFHISLNLFSFSTAGMWIKLNFI